MRSMRRRHSFWIALACALGLALSLGGCFEDMGDPLPPESGDGGNVDVTDVSSDSNADESTDTSQDAQTLIDAGKVVFLTAGGVGCASCHGANAEGKSGLGPNIRGKSEAQIVNALTTVKLMAFLQYPDKLTPADVHAVAAYLGWLATQPP